MDFGDFGKVGGVGVGGGGRWKGLGSGGAVWSEGRRRAVSSWEGKVQTYHPPPPEEKAAAEAVAEGGEDGKEGEGRVEEEAAAGSKP